MNIMGIDPGKGGGICFKMPKKSWIINMPESTEELANFARAMKKDHGGYIVFIEKVQMWLSDTEQENRGKAFRVSKMLGSYNTLIACFRVLGVPIVEVHPRTWQNSLKELGCKPESFQNPKNAWKLFAIEKFNQPKINLKTADACCIAWWGDQQVKTRPQWVMENLLNKETRNLFNYN